MGLHSFLGVLLVFFYKIYRLRVIAIFVFFVFEVSRGWIVVRYFCFVDNIWSLFARSFALRSLARSLVAPSLILSSLARSVTSCLSRYSLACLLLGLRNRFLAAAAVTE